MAIGLPVKANYAAGDILTATNMNDLSGTFNSVATSYGNAAGKNEIINAAMQVWQRGTSIAVTSGIAQVYTADRWWYANAASGMSGTVSRQATNDTTNLPFIQYCARVQRTAGNTNTTNQYFAQDIETINSIPFAGKTITVSWYARKGADYSSSGSALSYQVRSGTGTDQNMLSGYTGNVNLVNANVTLTTTWQRFTTTVSVGSTATQLGVFFFTNPTGTAGANDYFEITGVQLESASIATPFQTASGGSIQGELAMCQRYYEKSYDITTAPGTSTGAGSVYLTQGSDGANNSVYALRFKVEKRNSSWSAAYFTTAGVATVWNYLRSGVGSTGAAITTDLQSTSGARIYLNTGAAWTNNTIQGHWVIDNEL